MKTDGFELFDVYFQPKHCANNVLLKLWACSLIHCNAMHDTESSRLASKFQSCLMQNYRCLNQISIIMWSMTSEPIGPKLVESTLFARHCNDITWTNIGIDVELTDVCAQWAISFNLCTPSPIFKSMTTLPQTWTFYRKCHELCVIMTACYIVAGLSRLQRLGTLAPLSEHKVWCTTSTIQQHALHILYIISNMLHACMHWNQTLYQRTSDSP